MTDNTINNDMTMGGAAATLLAGRYRVVRQLGQGGMGSVWLAEDTKLDGFKVAIKMLPSVLISNKRALKQVKQEALVSLRLSHPNIATVRAFEEENGNPFLVMDYIEGQTLDDYLDEKGKLTEEETIRFLKPVAAALDYAHSQGVVHRDVKPGNIMIRKDGTPFVLDFGIAREIQETMTRVTGKLSSGTLMYMSPEQLHGAAPRPAQDVYSFAAMAYECLNGEPPFCRGQVEYQIVNDAPKSMDPQISIGDSVLAGLAKTPTERPSSCVEVLCVARSRARSAKDPVLSCSDGERDACRQQQGDLARSLMEVLPTASAATNTAGEGKCEDAHAEIRSEKDNGVALAVGKSRRSVLPWMFTILLVVSSLCASLSGFKAYRYSQMSRRHVVCDFDRQQRFNLNRNCAVALGVLALLFVVLACGRGSGYCIRKKGTRLVCSLMLGGSVVGTTLCAAQASFLADEIAHPTGMTKAYSQVDRENFRRQNIDGFALWSIGAMTFACLLCLGCPARKESGVKTSANNTKAVVAVMLFVLVALSSVGGLWWNWRMHMVKLLARLESEFNAPDILEGQKMLGVDFCDSFKVGPVVEVPVGTDLSEVVKKAVSGTTFRLKAGEYLISKNIGFNMKKSFRFVGISHSSTIIRGREKWPFFISKDSLFVMENLTIKSDENGWAVSADGDLAIVNCNINGGILRMNDKARVLLCRSRIISSSNSGDWAISIGDDARCYLSEVEATQARQHAVIVFKDARAMVKKSVFSNKASVDDVVRANGDNIQLHIEDTKISTGSRGLFVGDGGVYSLKKVKFEDCAQYGIAGGAGMPLVDIYGCTFKDVDKNFERPDKISEKNVEFLVDINLLSKKMLKGK